MHLDHDLARRQQGISFNPNVHHNATMPRLLNASMASEDSCGALRQERCRAVHGVRPVAAFAGRLAERGEGGHRRLVSTANVFAHTRDCRTQSRTSSALVEDTMKLKMNLSLLLASASLIGALFAPTVGMAIPSSLMRCLRAPWTRTRAITGIVSSSSASLRSASRSTQLNRRPRLLPAKRRGVALRLREVATAYHRRSG